MRKLLLAFDKEMKGLEYILDKENQKRKRQDPIIKMIWGWFFNRKGSIYDVLKIYQPTIGVFECSWKQDKVNETWTKRRVQLHNNVRERKKASFHARSSSNPKP